MHESTTEIEALQQLLDETYKKAGVHYRSIHTPTRRMSAAEVCAQLEGVAIFDLATVSKLKKPVVAPVDGLFFKARLWFSSAESSIRFRHIRDNPYVSAAYTLGEEISIMIHGQAHEVDTSQPGHEALHEYCLETYGPSYDSWGLWGKSPFAWVQPSVMYASRPGVDR
ncbi:MAG: pyridoxamine 5'-phosphate oxidase family protein [Pseudomonadales bacterium]